MLSDAGMLLDAGSKNQIPIEDGRFTVNVVLYLWLPATSRLQHTLDLPLLLLGNVTTPTNAQQVPTYAC